MGKRRMATAKLTRLEARTRFIKGVCRLVFVVFCMSAGFVVVATAFPQRRELERLEAKLALAKEREASIIAERDNRQIEYRALKEDPEFLEIHARDRLDYSREGEKVLRFPREH